MNPYEDNWQDVLRKAMRGLSMDETTLSQSSGIPLQEVKSLLEGNLHKNNLLRLAPVLSLDPTSLLDLANEIAPISVALPEQVLCFTTPFHDMKVHSYLLWSEKNKRAVAFDTGTNASLLLKELAKHQLKLQSIFLTHSHRDHLAELNTLIEATGAEAWIDSEELVPGTKPLDFFRNSTDTANCGVAPELERIVSSTPGASSMLYTLNSCAPSTPCTSSASASLERSLLFSSPSWRLDEFISIEARSTPGHSPGGTTYIIRGLSSPVPIVGDAIFARSEGDISPSAYPSALKAIQNNILSLPHETILAPGHGPLTTVGEELKHNPFWLPTFLEKRN